MANKVVLIQDYCTIVKKLINYYYRKTNDPEKDKYKNRAFIFINSTPGQVLEITGPVLFERREAIVNNNEGVLLNELKNTHIDDIEAQNLIKSIIFILDNSTPNDKKIIMKDIKELSDIYIKFLIACKNS